MSAPKYSAGVLSTAKKGKKHAPLPGSLSNKEERKFHSLLVLYRGDISTVTFMDIICKEMSKICMLELSVKTSSSPILSFGGVRGSGHGLVVRLKGYVANSRFLKGRKAN